MLNLIGCEPRGPENNPWFLFLGFIFITYILYHLIKSRKKIFHQKPQIDDSIDFVEETDVLGMKSRVHTDISNYTTLDKLMSWKVFILIVLIYTSVYLIYSDRPNVKPFETGFKAEFSPAD